ncbi:methylmalonyl-CoA mutase [Candidatus Bathyarchaeota archaeon]|nr:methylmalonyl-CoA mutase family protein [Candidatus Bathyarchaeota archaeon]NIU81718.1 methylmalonyl-CoA mutase [Candidatus Bathyarchaeota archaeon]NIV68034.1 methylmalonyl-CoA mutase [Candidatus Bathyarchaeota archaeon]NIW16443.1 methylmalonyl-CoA mutase [Candidatus Bathyarchaeota archaeon]NIW34563.1 methylmalonyl-CoA mutase [Candidatus Bathyarchaeota archaeon]
MFKEEKLQDIQSREKTWEERVLSKFLAKLPERKEKFTTASSIPVDRVYTPLHIEDLDYTTDLAFPGEYPFTRGVYPTMYRARLWTMRQYAGFGTAEETNARFKYLLNQGQTGLSVAFDLPTQIGLDCDHPLSQGEVGKAGVSVSTLKDMEILFDGIPLEKVTTSMTINAPATVILAMYIAVAEKQGVAIQKLGGTTQNDILKEFIARGMYAFPPKPSMRLVTDIFEYCSENMPRWNTISISGYHIREAGATATQEIAFTLANGIAYVEAAVRKGLDLDEFARRLSFFFAAHNNFLEEIAKFRAARRLWAKIMRERFEAENPRSWLLRFHTQTSGSTLTAQQPKNNIVRVAFQALAAVLGGTQSLHTNSFDEAYALPSKEAVRTALRTQQIIAHESGVTDTIDALGGSYYIEYLTDRIEEEAQKYIDRIDSMDGAVAAIEKGYIQREIVESAYRYQKQVEGRKKVVVGVNQFKTEEESPIPILRVDPTVEDKQIERLNTIQRKRDKEKVDDSLDNLRHAAEGDDNLMPVILRAVKEYASLGEICGVLREIFGEYEAPTIF